MTLRWSCAPGEAVASRAVCRLSPGTWPGGPGLLGAREGGRCCLYVLRACSGSSSRRPSRACGTPGDGPGPSPSPPPCRCLVQGPTGRTRTGGWKDLGGGAAPGAEAAPSGRAGLPVLTCWQLPLGVASGLLAPRNRGRGVCACRAVRSKVSLLTPNKAAAPGGVFNPLCPYPGQGLPVSAGDLTGPVGLGHLSGGPEGAAGARSRDYRWGGGPTALLSIWAQRGWAGCLTFLPTGSRLSAGV